MRTGFANIICCSSSLKMMPCTMFRSIQTFSVTIKFSERYHIFCAQIDLLFTIFVCSCYRLWATIRLLHHFGFVMCVNSRLYCTHFSCHWRKIRNVSHRLTQISKRQCDPCFLLPLTQLTTPSFSPTVPPMPGLSPICTIGSKTCLSITCSPILSNFPVVSLKVLSWGLSSSPSSLHNHLSQLESSLLCRWYSTT